MKLIGKVAMELAESNKYKVLKKYSRSEYQECKKLIIPDVKSDIDKAVKNKNNEKLTKICIEVTPTQFQDDIKRYLEDQLPDGYYFSITLPGLVEYKFDIDTRVKCTKYKGEFIGYIVDRLAGWYTVVEHKDYDSYPDCWIYPVRANEGLELV